MVDSGGEDRGGWAAESEVPGEEIGVEGSGVVVWGGRAGQFCCFFHCGVVRLVFALFGKDCDLRGG